MTPLERFKVAAKLGIPDQVPVMPFTTGHYIAWLHVNSPFCSKQLVEGSQNIAPSNFMIATGFLVNKSDMG